MIVGAGGAFMGGWRFFAMAALLVVLLFSMPARAEEQTALRGIALVIGQSDYEHISKLPNPENDARAVEELLSELGFETDVASDRDARRLKRDLEGFVEDAEDADVAIIYYSGHGIEAGGENFLVPTDADFSSLDNAGESLVSLTKVLDELKQTVPVTIVLLDACRDNPFPAGTTLTLEEGGEALPIAAGGLGETRGVVALKGNDPASDIETFGQVIGYAAEPGKVALDGEPGGNSPYAAAILRHLGAMGGDEFGLVLRMIGEEVYLKTGGKQRPWVNESLRKLLYFGGEAPQVAGEEGEILGERRQLLVTISALPDPERRQIEAIARDGGVPMDALYAMLKTLGADKPADPGELDKLLRSQTDRLKEILAEQATLKSTDDEIVRLSGLAAQALSEGALEAAKKFHELAKARVMELSKTVDQAEADIKARRLEFAEVFADSAKTYELSFEFERAAADYAKAFDQVAKWDATEALYYKSLEAGALGEHGNYTGDNEYLRRAVTAYEQSLSLLSGETKSKRWAVVQNNMAATLSTLGERESGR